MIFLYNDKTYRVDFHYETIGSHRNPTDGSLSNIKNHQVLTAVEISLKEGKGQYKGLAGSFIIRDPRDPFDKALGRRLSLSFAAKQLSDKDLRKAIWKAYFKNHRDGKLIQTNLP